MQNQKFRRSASIGETFGSSQPCEPTAEWSSTYVDAVDEHRHPADAAFGERDLESGNRVGMRAHSQSAAVTSAFTGKRLV